MSADCLAFLVCIGYFVFGFLDVRPQLSHENYETRHLAVAAAAVFLWYAG